MNATNIEAMREALRKEIRELELEEARIQERRAEKQRTLDMLAKLDVIGGVDKIANPSPHAITASKRKSIKDLGIHAYRIGNMTLRYPGEVLDYFNVDHYNRNKKGDGAAREILRWAKRDPVRARTVSVVREFGIVMDLHTAVMQLDP